MLSVKYFLGKIYYLYTLKNVIYQNDDDDEDDDDDDNDDNNKSNNNINVLY